MGYTDSIMRTGASGNRRCADDLVAGQTVNRSAAFAENEFRFPSNANLDASPVLELKTVKASR